MSSIRKVYDFVTRANIIGMFKICRGYDVHNRGSNNNISDDILSASAAVVELIVMAAAGHPCAMMDILYARFKDYQFAAGRVMMIILLPIYIASFVI